MTARRVTDQLNLQKCLEMLFKSGTRALIAWNLLIHKELTVKQLAKLIDKDVSTITRNLRSLEKLELLIISKIETVRNININYWKLNPKIPIHKFGDLGTEIDEAYKRNDIEFIKIMLLAIQRNLENVLNYKTQNIKSSIEDIFSGKEVFSVGIMDKETGKLFTKELRQFLRQFQNKHKLDMQSIDEINSESFFSFVLTSKFPSLHLSKK